MDTYHVVFMTSTQQTFEADVEAQGAVEAAGVAQAQFHAEHDAPLAAITHLLVRILRDDHL